MTIELFPTEQSIPLSQLLVDVQNPRLPDVQDSQRDAIQSMLRSQGEKLVVLAQHLYENGPNPASLPIVSPSEDEDGMYDVLDGNRRITALKLLETPSLAQGVLDNSSFQRLQRWSETFRLNPLATIKCIIYPDREAADPWIQLIHRGQSQGAGLVEWDGQVAARYDARKGNKPAALQILDFVKMYAALSSVTRERISNGKFPITTLVRLITSPYIREKLGLEFTGRQVVSLYPREEVIKGLTRIFEDLGSGTYTVSRLKGINQRLAYIDEFSLSELPDSKTKLPQPVNIELSPSLSEIASSLAASVQGALDTNSGTTRATSEVENTSNNVDAVRGTDANIQSNPNIQGTNSTGSTATANPPRRSSIRPRSTLVPRDCRLSIPQHRLYNIFNFELKTLNVDEFPNSGAVMLRVFLELSLDYFIEQKFSWPEQQRQNSSLATKLDAVANHMRQNGILTADELEPIRKAAAGQTLLAAAIRTMNGYVHSRHYSPVGSELRVAWDDMQLFLVKLWQHI